jgi:hypothetical protein
VTSFSLYLHEISGWPDVSLDAKTDGNGSMLDATGLHPSHWSSHFPSHLFCIFNFWITLVLQKQCYFGIPVEASSQHVAAFVQFLVMDFSHFMLFTAQNFWEYLVLWVGVGHGQCVTFVCDVVIQ